MTNIRENSDIEESTVVRGGKVSAEAVFNRAKEIAAKAGHKAVKNGPSYTDAHVQQAKKELLGESLAGESRGAEHEFSMGGSDDHSGSSVSKPSHAIKVGSSHFHPGKKGVTMAAQRSKALGVKPKIVPHPGGKLLGEEVEESVIVEGKLPDWAQAEFDAAFKKTAKKHVPDNDDSPAFRMTAREKADGERRKSEQHASSLRAKVTRTVKGTRGMSYDPDKEEVITHKHEHPEGAPDKHPHTALDNNPMVPKVKVSAAQKAAGPQRPKGKAATPAAMAEYRKALRDHNMKKESYIFDGAEFVLENRMGPAFFSKPAKTAADPGAEKALRSKEKELEKSARSKAKESSGYTADTMKKGECGVGARGAYGTRVEEIELTISKNNSLYNYNVTFGDDVIFEGNGVTIPGVLAEATRKMQGITEDVMHKEGQVDRIKSIIKQYTNK
jgi:hypothetical protein